MLSFLNYQAETDSPCQCGDCDWHGETDDTLPIEDIDQRLTPGSIVPVGECPECGSLAYYVDATAPSYCEQRKLYDLAQVISPPPGTRVHLLTVSAGRARISEAVG